ncbi:hypothetical protein JIN84_07060 [Luteolibacter yonseiensis]|uniref:Uncharacterized protein n=1 Tax=Luteolibacter yonseiensis TaxID=1144680 RepID=A0A934R1S3_9BACT|nr:hypothetical protein [Luteolibacter yonseiensis]MBK1815366.1 hypothetical protein [Luteolibacter yonseiensis]
MKTPDIQCGIASTRRRTGGEAPDIGRVSRLRGGLTSSTGTRRLRRRGEGKPDANRSRVLLVWSVLLGGATLGVLGVCFSLWAKSRVFQNVVRTHPGEPVAEERVVSKFPSPSKEQALEKVKRALTNRNQDQMPALFRMGGATSAEVLEFLKSSEQRDGVVERYDWLSSMDTDGLLLEGVLVVYKNSERPVERLAFLTPDEAGEWKVDFDAFARSNRPSWQDLVTKKIDQGVVRVLVGNDSYYNGLYTEKDWVCYTIASPDTEELLRGYCKVGSAEARRMEQLFSQGQKMSRATIEIRRNSEAESKQFEITRIVAGDWVVAEPPGRHG